ncbi:response regulator receiver modulated metal dependent phosphohydrolase [Pseudoalteromonas luteoviolacea B = ATCC 29581]|nr:response regulator receiver modulated metal dependent phosphohydrolase [Pseudoalteromonas luteoviolacea B = ATCC 29581]
MALSLVSTVPKSHVKPWKCLIVDDEPGVHDITKLALRRLEFDERPIEFISAFSGEEARLVMQQNKDIALIFLDVVMESDDAGLIFAQWLREVHGNKFSRIVLRTGQPGQAPEEEVIMRYDINDYKQKTELDRTRLFSTVITALRTYRDIIEIDQSRKCEKQFRQGLEQVIEATSEVLETKNLKHFFEGILTQIVSILHIEKEGAFINVFKGVGAIYNNKDYEVIAEVGANLEVNLPENIKILFNQARELKESIIEDDIFIAYLPSNSEKDSLLYLKGVDIDKIHELDIQLLHMFCKSTGVAFDNLILNQEIINTQEELINRLGNAVESRSKESGNHIKRMASFSGVVGKALNLSEKQCQILVQATPMHDVGKIATPDHILLKPGRLDEQEFSIMKQHAELGYNILSGSELPIINAAAIIAKQHHEKYDGTGYPDGIKGEDIHIFARIVSVVDVFDALLHRRCYKEPWPLSDVIDLLKKGKGTQFDPKVVDALINNLDEIMLLNDKLTDAQGF